MTHPTVSEIIMNTKVDEGKLISGDEAKKAWANGETVEFHYADTIWSELPSCAQLSIFDDEEIKFRVKPKTLLINGIEAPSIKKESAIYRSNDTVAIVCESFEEAELMCLALRQVFGGSHDN